MLTRLYDYDREVHGFMSLIGLVALADTAVSVASLALRRAFSGHR
jgi:hypothetical protein